MKPDGYNPPKNFVDYFVDIGCQLAHYNHIIRITAKGHERINDFADQCQVVLSGLQTFTAPMLPDDDKHKPLVDPEDCDRMDGFNTKAVDNILKLNANDTVKIKTIASGFTRLKHIKYPTEEDIATIPDANSRAYAQQSIQGICLLLSDLYERYAYLIDEVAKKSSEMALPATHTLSPKVSFSHPHAL